MKAFQGQYKDGTNGTRTLLQDCCTASLRELVWQPYILYTYNFCITSSLIKLSTYNCYWYITCNNNIVHVNIPPSENASHCIRSLFMVMLLQITTAWFYLDIRHSI